MQAHVNVAQSHPSLDWTDSRVLANGPQTIAVVDGNATVVSSIDTAMGAACHTVLLLDTRAHAYTDIRRLQPSLVVVCIHLDNPRSIQLLTMLKMDHETGSIPVTTIVVDSDDDVDAAEDADDAEDVACGELPTSVWVN
jgi:PleD family two-component response regulator